MDNPKQWRKGERVTAKKMNARIVDYLMSALIGGNGIRVRRAGDKIVIEYDKHPIIPK